MPAIVINSTTVDAWKRHSKNLIGLISEYKQLTDSYIIEFFVKDHWNSLSMKWRQALESMQPSDVSCELFSDRPDRKCKTVFPLSLLAFKSCCLKLGLSRSYDTTQDDNEFSQLNQSQSKLVNHIFRKHVKPKKQHEIRKLAEIIVKVASSSGAQRVIDIGSGQGHLSRLLAIGHDLVVSSLESDAKNIERAKTFDKECINAAVKLCPEKCKTSPCHTTVFIKPFLSVKEFLDIFVGFKTDEKLVVTGLHACGDLSMTMIDTFVNCDNVKALVSIACCYMKLSTLETRDEARKVHKEGKVGYPVSHFIRSLKNHHLDYKAREISCHANENFANRLLSNGDELKVHCYRAVLESIIRESNPHIVRPGIQSIKKPHLKSFCDYATSSLEKLQIASVSMSEICSEKVDIMLSQWQKVAIFYALCLLLAPLIESVILLDRAIFLFENGIESKIECVFDPKLSPRCFALVAQKEDVNSSRQRVLQKDE